MKIEIHEKKTEYKLMCKCKMKMKKKIRKVQCVFDRIVYQNIMGIMCGKSM